MGLSFLYHHYGSMQVKGVMHGVKWASAGNDRMVKMVSLYLSQATSIRKYEW